MEQMRNLLNRLTLTTKAFALAGAIALPLGPAAGAHAAAADCQFVLGFHTLHDMVPAIVGDCLDNVQYNPENGDALQHTTDEGGLGLLVWRKSDNFTAFTNGFQTWVNGPFGLQTRLNSQRFWWEFNPMGLPLIPQPVPGERCHTGGLSLEVAHTEAGAGNVFATLQFTNRLNVSCTFYGFPGAQLLDAANNALPTSVVWGGGQLANQPGPSLVRVPAQGTGSFDLHWGQIPVGNETCPVASQVKVIPPDEFAPLIVPLQVRACNGGRVDVSAVRGSQGP